MRLENYPLARLEGEILETLGKHLDLSQYRVFFFGSRVSGGGTERSDIDIGIEGVRPVPDKTWIELQEAFDNFPVLYKMEIVDFGRVASDFKEIALKHIRPIYPQYE